MTMAFILWIPYIFYYRLRQSIKHDVIFSQSWAFIRGAAGICFNWGDELNKYFFSYVTGMKTAFTFHSLSRFLNLKHYFLIGSILTFYNMDGAVIYGSGSIKPDNPRGIPESVISVRGPLTRELMLKHGINCPAHYGDPALLLPVFYTPKKINLHTEFSVIPHWRTMKYGNKILNQIMNQSKCNVVNMRKYKCWTDIIDVIAGSSFVLSESLHGLIVAETYNIPCVWVEFRQHFSWSDWNFKFHDFYESIGKYDMQSIKLYEGYNFDELMTLRDKWKPGNIDYEKQLEYFPFEIKPEFKSQIAEFLRTHKNSPRS